LLGARPNDTRRYRKLTNMPHGMFGAVHQAADYSRGQTRPSDCAEVAERRRIDGSQLRDGRIDTSDERRT
jgi:hypothetical protein